MLEKASLDASVEAMVARAELARLESAAELGSSNRRQLGQYFTPAVVAELVVRGARLPLNGTLRVLDPGAGTGSLSTALIARVLRERPQLKVEIVAVECDVALVPALERTLKDCAATAASLGATVVFKVEPKDFVEWATEELSGLGSAQTLLAQDGKHFDLVITNPPYRKLSPASIAGRALSAHGVDAPNTYAAFLALGILLLQRGGQLAAITPRSFTNGVYFRNFRRWMLARVGIDRLTSFKKRDILFAEDDVLQENLVLAATRDLMAVRTSIVTVGDLGVTSERAVHYEDVVLPSDPEAFVRIPAGERESANSAKVLHLPTLLQDLGLGVSTGRVVDFRCKAALRSEVESGTVPLIYPSHLKNGRVAWPIMNFRKWNAICDDETTAKMLLPAGWYVLVKRFSVKEESRRIVAAVFEPGNAHGGRVGFENHLNVIHCNNVGFDEALARGLNVWLNSTVLDDYYRQISGHTQVNATDLRNLPFPTTTQLLELGKAVAGGLLDQDKLDSLVALHVFSNR